VGGHTPRVIPATAWLALPLGTKPFRRIMKRLETSDGYRTYPCSVGKGAIEAVTVVLGLLGAGLFLAHAVDAYLTS
jgi:hypothetical protein